MAPTIYILVLAWYMSRQLNVNGNNAGGAYVGLLNNAILCMYPLILTRIYIYLSEYKCIVFELRRGRMASVSLPFFGLVFGRKLKPLFGHGLVFGFVSF